MTLTSILAAIACQFEEILQLTMPKCSVPAFSCPPLTDILFKTPKSPFRFLDLPPELRNAIYILSFSGEDERNLCYFRTPNLTKVSKQLRSESLAIFFAESKFYINVYTNFDDYYYYMESIRSPRTNASPDLPSFLRPIAPRAGLIYTNRAVRDFVLASNGHGIFRNITFRPHHKNSADAVIHKAWTLHGDSKLTRAWSCPCAFLGAGTVRIEPFCNHERYNTCGCSAHVRLRHFDLANNDRIKRTVESLAARSGFEGFTFGDLKDIARQYKWTEPILLTVAETTD